MMKFMFKLFDRVLGFDRLLVARREECLFDE